MAQQQPARRKTRSSKAPVSIPDKLYFRIGDVSRLCNLPAYVLRFWETEFPQLKPNKGGTGQRLYRKRDVEIVLEIKRLLYDEGFTIAGARRLLSEKRRTLAAVPNPSRDLRSVHEAPATKARSISAGKLTQTGKGKLAQTGTAPKIQELRKEVRELLALLGSSPQERKPQSAPAKRDTKKSNRTDEPRLF